MRFGIYFKQMIGVILSSTLALGMLAGLVLLIFGDFTMNLEGDIEVGRFDGLWLVFGLPLLTALVFVVLSPLSFLISRLLSRQRRD
ncbi:MAG: hypothetical protein DRQ63_11810 [Gammaproteobacteria bacterium]|nr:MAG: hypothetical protein DRQ63_11810 [Gammaproteobacteria bacterium]